MITRSRPWPAFWSLCLGFFLVSVDGPIVSVAVPDVVGALQTDTVATLWVVGGYLLAYAAPLLITGWLGDRFGDLRVYLLGLTVLLAASTLCALAPTLWVLVLGRVAQGLGAALMAPQTLSTITRIMPTRSLGIALGIWGAVAGLANVVAPVLGGALITSAGWRSVFWLNLPLGALALIAAAVTVPDHRTQRHRSLDAVSAALSVVGIAAIIVPLQAGSELDWPVGISLFAVGCTTIGYFLVRQRHPDALIPLELLRSANWSSAAAGTFAVSAVVTGVPVLVMLVTQQSLALSAGISSLFLLPVGIASIVVQPVVGRLLRKTAPRLVGSVALLLLTFAIILLSAAVWALDPAWIIGALVLVGVSAAGVWSPMSMLAMQGIDDERRSAGSAGYNLARQLGAAVAGAGAAVLLSWQVSVRLPADALGRIESGSADLAARAGYAAAIAVPLAIIAVLPLTAAMTLMLSGRARPDRLPPTR